MHLSARTEYACLALLELAQHYASEQPVQVKRIAARQGIPTPFLVQILQDLKRAGLACSTRGAAGGYRLARSPEQITLAEVWEMSEGPWEQHASATESSPLAPVLLEVCQELSAFHRERLTQITLAELLGRAAMETSPMWYI